MIITTDMNKEEIDVFKEIRKKINVDIKPSNSINFENDSNYEKVKLNDDQKRALSILLHEVPLATAAGAMSNAYVVKFPKGLPHVLTELKQGGVGSMIHQDGKIVGHASFFLMSAQATVLSVFTILSVITGQFFMSQINKQLKLINEQLTEILNFLHGEKKAELISEINFVKYAYENYASIMEHESQLIATIGSLQDSRKIAMKDIEFYLLDLKDFEKRIEKANTKERVENVGKELINKENTLIRAMELYVISSLLEIYFSQNMNEDFLNYLNDNICIHIRKCHQCIQKNYVQLMPRVLKYAGGKKIEADVKNEMEKYDFISKGEISPLEQKVQTLLQPYQREQEYYLDAECNVYMKKISVS